jgi:hypothetical protein
MIPRNALPPLRPQCTRYVLGHRDGALRGSHSENSCSVIAVMAHGLYGIFNPFEGDNMSRRLRLPDKHLALFQDPLLAELVESWRALRG